MNSPSLIESILPLAELKPGSRLLDLGCGGGTIRYSDYPGIRFVGVDRYRDPRSHSWPDRSALVLADAEHLPFADGSFDGAICNFVFEHFDRPEPALRELDRVVAPHGFLYASIPLSRRLHDRLYRFALKGGGHVQRYTFEGFLRLIYRETGFKMRAFAPVQSGFNWVQSVPLGSAVYRLLFHGLRFLGKAGVFPMDGSDYLFLFSSGADRGYRTEASVCAACGAFGTRTPEPSWQCQACGFRNVTVPSSLEIPC
jgi:ubiquinone/menaquinone biosynthesis C-methylase UbiE